MNSESPNITPVVDALEGAAAFVESAEMAQSIDRQFPGDSKMSLPEHLAALALLWSARQMRALALLFRQGFTIEAEPIVRSLLETAITTAWVGSSAERAERYQNQGLDHLKAWMEAMIGEVPNLFSTQAQARITALLEKRTAGPRMPSVEKRCSEAKTLFKDGLLRRAYRFAYRRLSAAVHADLQLGDLILNEPPSLASLDAQDAAVAAAIVVACAGNVLGSFERTRPIAQQLIDAAHEVRRLTSAA